MTFCSSSLLSFLGEVRVQSRVLERDRGLRCEHGQELHARGRERRGHVAVLEVEHTQEAPLMDHRQRQQRQHPVRDEVWVAGEARLRGHVAHHHGLARARHVLDDGRRDLAALGERLGQACLDAGVGDRQPRDERERFPATEHQGAALRACVLEHQLHQPAHHALRVELAREGLGRAHRGLHVERCAAGAERGRGRRGRAIGGLYGDRRREQGGVLRFQMDHHGQRAPARVGVAGLVQIQGADAAPARFQVELGAELGREGLDVQEALLAGDRDGLVVPGHGLVAVALHPGVLGFEEALVVQEVLGAPLGEVSEAREAMLDVLAQPRELLTVCRLVPALCGGEGEP
jgi:hypothetical protein